MRYVLSVIVLLVPSLFLSDNTLFQRHLITVVSSCPVVAFSMPREPLSTHRIKRHYHPPSARARFSPERHLSPSGASARLRFPIETATAAKFDPTSAPQVLIPKPKGEASRLSRGGYNVRKTLQWDDARYDDLLVRPADFSYTRGSYYFCSIMSTVSQLYI